MPTTVVVNNLTVVHRESGGVTVAFPDVCKTPSPGGPVPIPYPNTARAADTARGSRTVTADGNPLLLKSSCFSTSTGDEPGTAGGVVSGKTKGKAYPKSYSFDVKVEGENVVRNTDLMLQNGGSPTNTPPAPIMQPNATAGKAGSVKDWEVLSLAWGKAEAYCGDDVPARVETRDAPDGPFFLFVYRAGEEDVQRTFMTELQGNRSEKPWSVERGPYAKDVKLELRYRQPDGKEVKSGELEVKGLPTIPVETVGPLYRLPPEFTQLPSGQWIPTGFRYRWQYYFQIEVAAGELIVRRHVEFDPQSTATPPTQIQKQQWKAEIERIWDKKWRFHRKRCGRGSQCTCRTADHCCALVLRVQVEFGPSPVPSVDKVKLFPGACDPQGRGKKDKWWYSDTWWEETKYVGNPATVRAHEFGHLIGMYDEYPAGACDPARKYTNERDSIMNVGTTVFERHIAGFLEWLDKKLANDAGPMEPTPC